MHLQLECDVEGCEHNEPYGHRAALASKPNVPMQVKERAGKLQVASMVTLVIVWAMPAENEVMSA